MRCVRGSGVLLALLAWVPAGAAAVREYAVEVSATVMESPPRIDFVWTPDPTATEYLIYKKGADDTAWTGPVAVLGGSASSWSDEAVAVGEAHEYAFRKTRGLIRDTVAVAAGAEVVFQIRDSWGDGICCANGLGFYEVSGCDTTWARGGSFGSAESTTFIVDGPGGPCGSLVVKILLDAFGQETTWDLADGGSGAVLAEGGPYAPPEFGHIFAGIRFPEPDEPGAVLLLVEESLAAPLAQEIRRLEIDMVRDGYRVHRGEVPASLSVPEVKQRILSELGDDPAIETVFLLGRVAVPYSGDVQGAHPDHHGAWPADLYYGDLDGRWTDSIVNTTTPARPENDNVPGDGKFDQTYLPSDVELRIGRVDLSRLPAFAEDEIALLHRYLDKNHAFRGGEAVFPRRGIIDDNVGELDGTAYACTGWRNFTTMFGSSSVSAGNWIPDLQTDAHLFAYGCGPSGYTACGGVATTQDFATHSFRAVFTMLMGSYFGDWDNSNNVLRSPLASEGGILTCCWAGRPPYHLHHMALGLPIGHAVRLTQNNWTLYTVGYGGRQIHTALMGDPTLTMHPVPPPRDLVPAVLPGGGVRLAWSPPPDTVVGYHVYRADSLGGVFERLSESPVAETSYVDDSPPNGRSVYLVRPVKLETTSSGTFLNVGVGAIDSVDAATGVAPPRLERSLESSPNPFGEGTAIRFQLASPGRATLRVYDAAGRLVRDLGSGERGAGAHVSVWDGRDDEGRPAASGVYFLSLETGGETLRRKLILVR